MYSVELKAWKHFDYLYQDFSGHPFIVHIALASNGFNPLRTMNATNCIWPVILIAYNLLAWLCIQQPNFIPLLIILAQKYQITRLTSTFNL